MHALCADIHLLCEHRCWHMTQACRRAGSQSQLAREERLGNLHRCRHRAAQQRAQRTRVSIVGQTCTGEPCGCRERVLCKSATTTPCSPSDASMRVRNWCHPCHLGAGKESAHQHAQAHGAGKRASFRAVCASRLLRLQTLLTVQRCAGEEWPRRDTVASATFVTDSGGLRAMLSAVSEVTAAATAARNTQRCSDAPQSQVTQMRGSSSRSCAEPAHGGARRGGFSAVAVGACGVGRVSVGGFFWLKIW
jgi:hypothetical protein